MNQTISGNTGFDQSFARDAQRHALVLGGSLAGLLAARVLADHFERVTIVERDEFSDQLEARRGTPQANHVHALMPRGRLILEELFPGLHQEMMTWGAPLVDMANDVAWLTPQGWGVNFPSDLQVLSFTRPLLDLHVRRRIAANRRIQIMQSSQMVGFIGDDGDGIAGATVRTTSSDGETLDMRIPADLVVDATGRASRAPEWLARIGYPVPEEITINAHLGYASRFYEIPSNFRADWMGMFVQIAPPKRNRGGILFKVEGNRWLVTMIGGGGDYPPKEEVAFLEFARSLPDQAIYEAIRQAKPLSPIRVHRGTENRLRKYDKLSRQPRNFVAVGDSVCAFNPVYAQGMTIAAIEALTLDACLRKWKPCNKDFGQRFQRQLSKVTAAPWMLATSEDFRYRETEGGHADLTTRLMHAYMDQVLKLATFDTSVRRVLLQAFGMLVPPTALFRPSIVYRVVRRALTNRAPAKPMAQPRRRQGMVYRHSGPLNS